MDEFIENFQTFRDWLHDYEKQINVSSEGIFIYNDIVNKFEELGLNDIF